MFLFIVCSAKAALLELYVPFARGHEAALRMLRTAMARPDVGRTVSGIASSDERVSGKGRGSG